MSSFAFGFHTTLGSRKDGWGQESTDTTFALFFSTTGKFKTFLAISGMKKSVILSRWKHLTCQFLLQDFLPVRFVSHWENFLLRNWKVFLHQCILHPEQHFPLQTGDKCKKCQQNVLVLNVLEELTRFVESRERYENESGNLDIASGDTTCRKAPLYRGCLSFSRNLLSSPRACLWWVSQVIVSGRASRRGTFWSHCCRWGKVPSPVARDTPLAGPPLQTSTPFRPAAHASLGQSKISHLGQTPLPNRRSRSSDGKHARPCWLPRVLMSSWKRLCLFQDIHPFVSMFQVQVVLVLEFRSSVSGCVKTRRQRSCCLFLHGPERVVRCVAGSNGGIVTALSVVFIWMLLRATGGGGGRGGIDLKQSLAAPEGPLQNLLQQLQYVHTWSMLMCLHSRAHDQTRFCEREKKKRQRREKHLACCVWM